MQLVEISKNEVYAESGVVSRKFGMKHSELTKTIRKVISKIDDLRGGIAPPKYYTEGREYRGNKFTAYIMSREFFSLVAMRLTNKKAFEWQVKFNKAFYEMERRLIVKDSNSNDQIWIENRSRGKLARREETDTIKSFVNYATKQGSTKANFYYKHITNATYKALGLITQRKPKLRDVMTYMELAELQLMEHRAKQLLTKYMELERNYKDIYNCVKDDLVEFGESLRLTPIK